MVTGPAKEHASEEVTPVHKTANKDIALDSNLENGNAKVKSLKKQDSIFEVGDDSRLEDEQLDELTELPISPGREVTVRLKRAADGFGLVIQGGRDRPYFGDVGIYITSIKPGSVAEKAALLDVDDKIIEINGHSVIDVEHLKAINYFKRSGSEVELTVKKNAGVILKAAFSTDNDPGWIERDAGTPEPPSDKAVKNFSAGGFTIGIMIGCIIAVMAKRYMNSIR